MPQTSASDGSLRDSDRARILDLYGRCALAVDEGDAESWLACFSADGRFAVPELVDAVGHAQLAEFVRRHHDSPNGAMRHHITTVSVRATSHGASGRAYALITHGGDVVGAVRYDDELIDEDGTWRFSARCVSTP